MPPSSAPQSDTSQAAAPVVEVAGLTKRFAERLAVGGIDFAIAPGECVALLGPNGAGKTTTIHMLLGLVTKTAGESRVFGLSLPRHLRTIKARVGVTPQADNLDPDLTVLENLLVYGSYFGIPANRIRQRADWLLHFFALANRRDEIIHHLSGGQRRRLLLARALINEPDFLILDEPTIGLDPQARHLIWERLAELREQGTTMLLTSHYMDEVSRLSNRVLIMDQGRIVAEGEPRRMITDMVGIDVFEAEGTGAELDRIEEALEGCQATRERVGDKLYIYTQEDCSRLEAILGRPGQWLRRPANLEDLFIRLTGRSLRES